MDLFSYDVGHVEHLHLHRSMEEDDTRLTSRRLGTSVRIAIKHQNGTTKDRTATCQEGITTHQIVRTTDQSVYFQQSQPLESVENPVLPPMRLCRS